VISRRKDGRRTAEGMADSNYINPYLIYYNPYLGYSYP
jgi:hypothetical protein